jgi:hypothetical protein
MNRVMPIVICVVLIASAIVVFAQDPSVEKVLLPAPRNMQAAATIIKWKSDFTYDTVRKGTNKLVCYERPTQPGDTNSFSVECTSIANLERVAVSLKTETIQDPKQRRTAFEELEKAGKWPKPEFGSVFYNLTGPDQANAHPHATVCVPGATEKTLGLPETGDKGGAWIMNAGTSAAHIMLPGH